ncbi:hypothetical protein SULI_14560 [Saccharolobus solfataricus]|uniref:DUF973 family protein n=3 Tax=Saccharolobus solfataricus TaxID=2287 RepID=Q7LX81_SACS2|nr:hypothetical protein [Saccharolobus solfataricus]AAK42294.1 Hypothetical protein SSO2115 [Saccharolobus solfataricus P2]AKA74908.1 hypothetical protein SULB_2854 [Saccharolobus solfataricus]AKA77604.1 hypothetical protein SULC_2851 [Saccharolobus solfataricus]AKA80295.1 hypothetical protein SULA_2854 [Saccharolobus solfataricus]AZF69374.1 hypothetical protein SULG_14560 [Saccharolobus solfataricus]
MSYKDLIKDANDFARVLIKRKSRKVLGIYYAVWGFYGLILASIYTVLDSLKINIAFLYGLIPFIILIPFVYFTVKLFRDIRTDYLRLIGSRGYIITKFNYVIWILITLALFISFILVSQFGLSIVYFVLSFYIYAIFLAYSLYRFLYSKYRFVDPRYYDIIAVFSILVAPLEVISQVFYLIFIIAWFYASINSLLEVSTIE